MAAALHPQSSVHNPLPTGWGLMKNIEKKRGPWAHEGNGVYEGNFY